MKLIKTKDFSLQGNLVTTQNTFEISLKEININLHGSLTEGIPRCESQVPVRRNMRLMRYDA